MWHADRQAAPRPAPVLPPVAVVEQWGVRVLSAKTLAEVLDEPS